MVVDDRAAAHKETSKGIILMCAGVFLLSMNDALAKSLADHYSVFQILFIRNALALPIAIGIAVRMGGRGALRSFRPAAHLMRGIFWLGAAFLFITSLRFLALAEATALVFAAPMVITALSALFLAEQVGWRRWSAVAVGFIGVLVVVRPGSDTFQLASLMAVGTAFLYAVLMLGARWVDPRESVWTLMVYLVGVGALLSGIITLFTWVPIRGQDLWLFVAIAACGTGGMTMMTQAFRFAPAAVVAPFDYSALLWATLLGFLVWGDKPDLATYIGAAIIIASGLYIVFREHRLKA